MATIRRKIDLIKSKRVLVTNKISTPAGTVNLHLFIKLLAIYVDHFVTQSSSSNVDEIPEKLVFRNSNYFYRFMTDKVKMIQTEEANRLLLAFDAKTITKKDKMTVLITALRMFKIMEPTAMAVEQVSDGKFYIAVQPKALSRVLTRIKNNSL